MGADFVASPEYKALFSAFEDVKEFDQPPFEIHQGDKTDKVFARDALVSRLMDEGRKGPPDPAVQAGLGEIEPRGALGDHHGSRATDARPGAARGREVAEVMFSTLMGDAVEPRRLFIEDNALNVRNLDV